MCIKVLKSTTNATFVLLNVNKRPLLRVENRHKCFFFFLHCPKSICHSWKMICRQFFFVCVCAAMWASTRLPEIAIHFYLLRRSECIYRCKVLVWSVLSSFLVKQIVTIARLFCSKGKHIYPRRKQTIKFLVIHENYQRKLTIIWYL